MFVPDFLPFGERFAGAMPGVDACDQSALWASALGYSLPRLNAQAVSRGIDYLQTREEADTNRIAMMGHSLGGFMTIVTSAIEPRIKASVVSGMLGSFHMAKGGKWYCGSQTIPGILRYGDMPDIAAMIAPRPLLAITGKYDCCAPFIYANQAYKQLEEIYNALGASRNLERFTFAGEHVFQPNEALDFIDKHLR